MRFVSSQKSIFGWFLVVILVGLPVEARVFDMGSEKFAAYLKANYGPSSIAKSTYEKVSPQTETYDGSISVVYAGEFGLVYSSKHLNVRFGIEVVRPPTLDVVASDSGGTKIYDMSSSITAIIPKIGFEYNVRKWKESRFFLGGAYGQATLGMTNSYSFTTAGNAAPTSGVDYTEDGRGSAALMEGMLGFETLMFDSTTIVFEAGYRQLKFASLTHNRDAVTIRGTKVKGDPMLNADDSARSISFTGYYAGLTFRFWIY
jgi:hypothetical protein